MTGDKILTLEDDRSIGYVEYGVPTGRPIFYFHGFPGSRLEARNFEAVALANAYRIIGVDRPGMGLSTIDKKRTLLSWAKDMGHIADRLGIEKFSIVGHSGGGPFVAACAYVMPNRLNGVAIVSGMAPFEIPEAKIGMARGQRIANSLIKALPWCTSIMMRLTRMMLQKPNRMLYPSRTSFPDSDGLFLPPSFV